MSTWTHHNTCGTEPLTATHLHICLSALVYLQPCQQQSNTKEPQKESCCNHLGRLEPAKHRPTQNLCLPPLCTAL
jgi:hypothetical protein